MDPWTSSETLHNYKIFICRCIIWNVIKDCYVRADWTEANVLVPDNSFVTATKCSLYTIQCVLTASIPNSFWHRYHSNISIIPAQRNMYSTADFKRLQLPFSHHGIGKNYEFLFIGILPYYLRHKTNFYKTCKIKAVLFAAQRRCFGVQ
jgi:hypothetical protein